MNRATIPTSLATIRITISFRRDQHKRKHTCYCFRNKNARTRIGLSSRWPWWSRSLKYAFIVHTIGLYLAVWQSSWEHKDVAPAIVIRRGKAVSVRSSSVKQCVHSMYWRASPHNTIDQRVRRPADSPKASSSSSDPFHNHQNNIADVRHNIIRDAIAAVVVKTNAVHPYWRRKKKCARPLSILHLFLNEYFCR